MKIFEGIGLGGSDLGEENDFSKLFVYLSRRLILAESMASLLMNEIKKADPQIELIDNCFVQLLENFLGHQTALSLTKALKGFYSQGELNSIYLPQCDELVAFDKLFPKVPYFNSLISGFIKEDLPWLMQDSQLEIIREYDATIVGEDEYQYFIEFRDYDSSVVEDSLPKKRFEDLPYEAGLGTHFWIVAYRMRERKDVRVSVWPVADYWNPSLLEK